MADASALLLSAWRLLKPGTLTKSPKGDASHETQVRRRLGAMHRPSHGGNQWHGTLGSFLAIPSLGMEGLCFNKTFNRSPPHSSNETKSSKRSNHLDLAKPEEHPAQKKFVLRTSLAGGRSNLNEEMPM